MKNIDVSIIIPCYNGAKFLPRLAECLKPLLTPQIEVIFIDDGSSDGSAELFQKLLPGAVCLKQENRGIGATRNRAAEMAHGEFLQLLDADDTIEPGKFEVQVPFARANGLDIVYSDWRMIVVDGDTEVHEPWVTAETKTEVVEALLGGWWYSVSTAIVRADAFRAVGGCDSTLGNTCEDFDLWARLGIAGYKFGYVPGRFGNYFRYKRILSVSRKNRREFLEGEARIILKAVGLLKTQNGATKGRLCAAARRLYQVARNFYGFDKPRYDQLMEEVRGLDPDFQPNGPFWFRLSARLVGLRGAEELALAKRRLQGRTH